LKTGNAPTVDGEYDHAIMNEILDQLPCPPYQHQREAIPLLVDKNYFCLADIMGAGKSATTLFAWFVLYKRDGYSKFLILCQKRAMQQWADYIDKFTPEFTHQIIDGPKVRRNKQWQVPVNIYITNVEKILVDSDVITTVNWDAVCVDEASYYIKNFKAKTSRHVYKIRAKKKYCLTGTPLENTIEDLFGIFRFLNWDVFGSYFSFKEKYLVMKKQTIWNKYKKRKMEFEVVEGFKNLDELKERIAPFYLRRTDDDILDDMPKLVIEDLLIPLNPKHLGLYKGLKEKTLEQLYVEYGVSMKDKRIKLIRLCGHSSLVFPDTNESTKLETLLSLVDENKHRKILIFSQWADIVKIISDSLKDTPHNVMVGGGSKWKFNRALDDGVEVAEFRDKNNIMVATDSLSRSADLPWVEMIINFDLPWNPATIKQRITRARRLSSTNKRIYVFNLVTKDTIESKVLPILQRKMDLFSDIIDNNEFNEQKMEQFNLIKLLEDE